MAPGIIDLLEMIDIHRKILRISYCILFHIQIPMQRDAFDEIIADLNMGMQQICIDRAGIFKFGELSIIGSGKHYQK